MRNMFPPMGMKAGAPAPFRAKPSRGPLPMGSMRGIKTMADGGMGKPSPFGGAPKMPPAPAAATDPDNDADGDMPMIKPEAVNYHDEPHSCSGCQYMDDEQQCAVLRMQVNPDGGCTAFEAKMDQGGEEYGGEEMPEGEQQ